MRFLKFLVVFMGVLIILGFLGIGVTIYYRLSNYTPDTPHLYSLDLPKEQKIVETLTTKKNYIFRIENQQGNEYLFFYDRKKLKLIRIIELNKSEPLKTFLESTKKK